jgi:hypothetical protein
MHGPTLHDNVALREMQGLAGIRLQVVLAGQQDGVNKRFSAMREVMIRLA